MGDSATSYSALAFNMAGAREAWADAMRVQPDFNPETYLPSFARLWADEAQFKTLRRGSAYRSCVGSAVKLSDRPNSRVEERRGSLGQASAISRLRIPCWRRLADFKVAVCAGDDEAALPEGFHGVLVNFYPWKLERNAPSEEERQAAAETLWEEFRGPLEHHLGVLVGKVRGRVMIVERGYVIKIKRRSRPWARSFSILRPPA